ncbi:translocation and assembly module lipoprotein TamL [Mucilaginibacter paludis]|uniref:Surface antigen (D15) n=1 Tax=Mucilaginibacter paludis DSM 18603 TaxID=714943 RepID=H1Y6F0_9SPHI|nr:BamA/TamA family outer membrane protein [Mucilaginibacter paludis]EHQ25794.1 surface antigen (D15) [Mucilaginibacter paludis DSM 18603]
MIKHLPYLFLLTLIIGGCSNIKYLPKNEKLYTGAKVIITDKDTKKSEAKALTTELTDLTRPKPNGSILGLRVKLYLYNISKGKKNFISRFINKLGEPPVLFSSVDLDHNGKVLTNRLQNKGYFRAQVTPDSAIKNKTAQAVYNTQTGPVFKIRKVVFPRDSDSLDTAVTGISKKSFLKPGDNYNLDVIKNERIRIDARLKEEGFYFFSPDDILLEVDSTNAGKNMVDLYEIVKPETPDKAWDIYTMDKTYIYPRYSLRDTAAKLDSAVHYNDYYVIDPRNTIHPYVFKDVIALHPGEAYNRTDHNQALSRFIDLGPYKYVKNRFDISPKDTLKLNAFYYLTPYPKKSLRFETLVRTTSANYNGTQVNLSFRNRNTFKGAELLTVSLLGSTDLQFGGQNNGYNVYQAGIQTSLTWPRFITPFNVTTNNGFLPHTRLQLEYDLTNRTKLYTLNTFSASYAYLWKQDIHIQHELTVFGFSYTNAANVTKIYTDSILHTRNPSLKHVIDNQLTFGPSYSYTYTNTTESYKRNTYYYNGKISLSGNILGLVTGADTLAGKPKAIFGTNYSQYVKLESELRYYHKISPNITWASRIIGGAGLTYGNSTIMPYSQQFFVGGANSLRGFRARSVGPGSYYPDATITNGSGFIPDESGDIKIEANTEFRPKLFSIVYGALFLDAGNVWLLHSNNTQQGGQPGGAFNKNFLNDMAVDAGLGLRFDLSVLVLRTDLGFPLRKPWLPDGQRWVINKIDFGNGGWRGDNLVFNLAIGYPF